MRSTARPARARCGSRTSCCADDVWAAFADPDRAGVPDALGGRRADRRAVPEPGRRDRVRARPRRVGRARARPTRSSSAWSPTPRRSSSTATASATAGTRSCRSTRRYKLVGLDQGALGGHLRRQRRPRTPSRSSSTGLRERTGGSLAPRASQAPSTGRVASSGRAHHPPAPLRRQGRRDAATTSEDPDSRPRRRCVRHATPDAALRPARRRPAGREVHTIALSAQIQIDPARATYDAETRARLVELFGAARALGRDDPGLPAGRAIEVLVPASPARRRSPSRCRARYDLEVAASKYFYSLPDGEVPLTFHFSGMVLYSGDEATGCRSRRCRGAAPRAGACRSTRGSARWPRYYPGGGWVRLRTRDARRLCRAQGRARPPQLRRLRRRPAPREAAAMTDLDELARQTLLWEGYALYPYTPGRDEERDADAVRDRLPAGLRRRAARTVRPAAAAALVEGRGRDAAGDRALPRARRRAPRGRRAPRRAAGTTLDRAADAPVTEPFAFERRPRPRALAAEDSAGLVPRHACGAQPHRGGARAWTAPRAARLAAVDPRRRRRAPAGASSRRSRRRRTPRPPS